MEWYERKRGRPPGSKTSVTTPGKKRAKEFLDLMFDAELRPTQAAKQIASRHSTKNNDVDPSQIFKDVKRHYATLAAEEQVSATKAEMLFNDLQSAMIGPQLPSDADELVVRAILNSISGQSK